MDDPKQTVNVQLTGSEGPAPSPSGSSGSSQGESFSRQIDAIVKEAFQGTSFAQELKEEINRLYKEHREEVSAYNEAIRNLSGFGSLRKTRNELLRGVDEPRRFDELVEHFSDPANRHLYYPLMSNIPSGESAGRSDYEEALRQAIIKGRRVYRPKRSFVNDALQSFGGIPEKKYTGPYLKGDAWEPPPGEEQNLPGFPWEVDPEGWEQAQQQAELEAAAARALQQQNAFAVLSSMMRHTDFPYWAENFRNRPPRLGFTPPVHSQFGMRGPGGPRSWINYVPGSGGLIDPNKPFNAADFLEAVIKDIDRTQDAVREYPPLTESLTPREPGSNIPRIGHEGVVSEEVRSYIFGSTVIGGGGSGGSGGGGPGSPPGPGTPPPTPIDWKALSAGVSRGLVHGSIIHGIIIHATDRIFETIGDLVRHTVDAAVKDTSGAEYLAAFPEITGKIGGIVGSAGGFGMGGLLGAGLGSLTPMGPIAGGVGGAIIGSSLGHIIAKPFEELAETIRSVDKAFKSMIDTVADFSPDVSVVRAMGSINMIMARMDRANELGAELARLEYERNRLDLIKFRQVTKWGHHLLPWASSGLGSINDWLEGPQPGKWISGSLIGGISGYASGYLYPSVPLPKSLPAFAGAALGGMINSGNLSSIMSSAVTGGGSAVTEFILMKVLEKLNLIEKNTGASSRKGLGDIEGLDGFADRFSRFLGGSVLPVSERTPFRSSPAHRRSFLGP